MEDIYMKQPEGFVEPGYEDYVCKLICTIYGMMQRAHDWYKTLNQMYIDLGYTSLWADLCVWFKREDGNYTLTDTYADNSFSASNSEEEEKRRKDEMGKVWEIKDVEENEYFLGMRVQQNLTLGTIQLTQWPYWELVLNWFSLKHITPRNTPLPPGIILDSNMSPKTVSKKEIMDNKPYRSVLGSVMWGLLSRHISTYCTNPRLGLSSVLASTAKGLQLSTAHSVQHSGNSYYYYYLPCL